VARVRMISPETADAELARVYDAVRAQWGRISNFSQVLAHQPAALQGWMLPNDAIRLKNVKTDPDYVKIQQLVIIKTSALNGSAYCLSHNVPLGKKIGLTEEQIAAAQGSDYMASPALDARQKAAIRWAEAVTNMTARNDAPRSQPRPAPIIPIFIWRALLPELSPHHHCGFLEPRLFAGVPGFWAFHPWRFRRGCLALHETLSSFAAGETFAPVDALNNRVVPIQRTRT